MFLPRFELGAIHLARKVPTWKKFYFADNKGIISFFKMGSSGDACSVSEHSPSISLGLAPFSRGDSFSGDMCSITEHARRMHLLPDPVFFQLGVKSGSGNIQYFSRFSQVVIRKLHDMDDVVFFQVLQGGELVLFDKRDPIP